MAMEVLRTIQRHPVAMLGLMTLAGLAAGIPESAWSREAGLGRGRMDRDPAGAKRP
jgi:hypothetical protein